jgi:hypothetical protein
MRTANSDIPNIPNTPEVGMHLSFGPARPLVLFPVRLETRFFPQVDGSSELRVRVYPDKIHIDSHEPGLTADELTWGKHFWEQTWRAANDEERKKSAWRQLADRFDPPRAAWIARALKPLNPEDRPANPVAADQPLPKPPRFPSPATKAEAWARAPATRVLPNLWILLGYTVVPLRADRPHAVPERPRKERPPPTRENPFQQTGEGEDGANSQPDSDEIKLYLGPRCRADERRTVPYSAGFKPSLGSLIRDPAASLNSERLDPSEAKS